VYDAGSDTNAQRLWAENPYKVFGVTEFLQKGLTSEGRTVFHDTGMVCRAFAKFVLHDALQGSESFSYLDQLSRGQWIGLAFGIAPFKCRNRAVDTANEFFGIGFGYG
jgi:hypothetical protein